MKELIENIARKFDSFRRDAESQLDKGNKSAGLLARRTSLEQEPLLKQFRKLSPLRGLRSVDGQLTMPDLI